MSKNLRVEAIKLAMDAIDYRDRTPEKVLAAAEKLLPFLEGRTQEAEESTESKEMRLIDQSWNDAIDAVLDIQDQTGMSDDDTVRVGRVRKAVEALRR